MHTGDGLLARLRVAGGRLTPMQLTAIAALAREHGNGLVEITARGNLQVRGLREQSRAGFARAVLEIVQIERGLIVETPPLASDDPREIDDPRLLAKLIRTMAEAFADRLGPKVTVIVDGNGQIGLGDLKADVRLTAVTSNHWAVSVGDGESETLTDDEALTKAVSVLTRLAALGPHARATDLVGRSVQRGPRPKRAPIGAFALREGSAQGIALPFGSMDAQIIQDLCTAAMAEGVTMFCLAPHHALIAIGASAKFNAQAESMGFITKLADPRLRVSACIGSEGCASGHIPARLLAAQLAPLVHPGTHLHVSGCTKGCAHPRRADTTFVGLSKGLGLVIDGAAGDSPMALLQADQLESALAAR
jgi:precorrin-3B synthase